MKKKLSSLKAYYKSHPKRFWVLGSILLIIVIYSIVHEPASTITVVPVERTDLKSTVLATGQVTSATDLSLSFSASGLVRTLPVSVGQKVYGGQVLATLENANEYAAMKAAQARYQKVVDGSSNQDVAVAAASLASAKASLENAERLQNTLVENAHRALLNADLTPVLDSGTGGTLPTVTGTYTDSREGSYQIFVYTTGSGGYFSYTGLEKGTADISTVSAVPIGTKGLYIKFPTNLQSISGNSWSILLPNTTSSNYVTAYNAYQNALQSRESALSSGRAAVAQAEADLALKKAPARNADVAAAQADVDAAAATYEKTVLRAPASGTVVRVDTKIGERGDAGKQVIVVQDVGNLYVEANINETNIAKVVLAQPVTMTLDAFGPDVTFTGKVVHIDPSATTTDGIANYQIKSSIKDESSLHIVRPGMNANMLITAWSKPGVIAVPKAAITTAADGTSTINVITDEKKNKTEVRAVTLGAQGDGNLVEIASGLTEGDKIAVGK